MTPIEEALDFARSLRGKTYHPGRLLSDNDKTCISINLPIKGHCTPTKRCTQDCYGKSGHLAYPNCHRKQKFVSKYLKQKNIDDLITECKPYLGIRLNGVGDLNPEHLAQLFSLARSCHRPPFWGLTRKFNMATAVNGARTPKLTLLLSVNAKPPD